MQIVTNQSKHTQAHSEPKTEIDKTSNDRSQWVRQSVNQAAKPVGKGMQVDERVSGT